MKIRNGYVSNSSSSSFIINFGKDIESAGDIPVRKTKSKKGMTNGDIANLLFGMLYNGYGLNLDEWLNTEYKDYKSSISTQPWKYRIKLEDLIECLKQKGYDYAVESLEKVRDWGDNENTYVFTVGSDSPMVMESVYGSVDSKLRDLSCEARSDSETFMEHFDKIICISD